MYTSDCNDDSDNAEDAKTYLEGYLGTVVRGSHVTEYG